MKRAILLLLLFAAACTFGPQEPTGPDNLQGTRGVDISIISMPGFVYENEQFPVVFSLNNRGVANVSPANPGRFVVSVDPLYVERDQYIAPGGFEGLEGGFFLDGRELYILGEEVYITQYLTARPIQRQSERITTPLTITACYPYETRMTTQVCIERARVIDPGSVACVNRPVRPPTQGAPVVVHEVETRAMPAADGEGVSLSFRIVLKNAGGGIAGTSGCFDNQINTQLNQVDLRARLLTEDLECGTGEDPFVATVRLNRGEGVVTCRLPDSSVLPPAQNNFLSLLSVDIDYSYRTSDRAEVNIVRVR